MIDLQAIEASPVDDTIKGMPGGLRRMALSDIGRQGWNVLREDLPLPLAVLKDLGAQPQWRRMRRFLAVSGARISPHGKTTMSPCFSAAKWTTAPMPSPSDRYSNCRWHAIMVDRVVMANQSAGRAPIGYVLDEINRDPAFDFYCLVDRWRW